METGYKEKYVDQTPRPTQPPNASGTQGDDITIPVKVRAELTRAKTTRKKAKWVCECPVGLDTNVWFSLVERLQKADLKLRVIGPNAVGASDKSHVRLFQAANFFAKLALVLPPLVAMDLAYPGKGEAFWNTLTILLPKPGLAEDAQKLGNFVEEFLLAPLLKDGEHEAVLSLLNNFAPAYISLHYTHLASFVEELENQGRHPAIVQLVTRYVSAAEQCLEQSMGRREESLEAAKKRASNMGQSALLLIGAGRQVRVRPDAEAWGFLVRLARLDAKWPDKPGSDLAKKCCALIAPKDLGRFRDQVEAEPKALKARADAGQVSLVCGYLRLVNPARLEGLAAHEEFVQSLELLAPLIPALEAQGMNLEAEPLEAELFEAIFRAYIYVAPSTFASVFKQAYPKASDAEVGYANLVFDALCKYGPGQVLKVEGLAYALAMIPYKAIQQAFTQVAGKL